MASGTRFPDLGLQTTRYVSVKKFSDPWLAVCDRCPLEDCVRMEGELQPRGTYNRDSLTECPIYIADSRGWDAAQALRHHQAWGLLEVE